MDKEDGQGDEKEKLNNVEEPGIPSTQKLFQTAVPLWEQNSKGEQKHTTWNAMECCMMELNALYGIL